MSVVAIEMRALSYAKRAAALVPQRSRDRKKSDFEIYQPIIPFLYSAWIGMRGWRGGCPRDSIHVMAKFEFITSLGTAFKKNDQWRMEPLSFHLPMGNSDTLHCLLPCVFILKAELYLHYEYICCLFNLHFMMINIGSQFLTHNSECCFCVTYNHTQHKHTSSFCCRKLT